MSGVARSVIDVILGEATRGTQQERFADMLAVASTIANRAQSTNTIPDDVVAVQSQFNAYGKALPAGVNDYREMAQTAWSYVNQMGPVHNGTFMATPAALANLPNGLSEVMRTSGHVYLSDPQGRSILTAQGYRAPVNPVVAMPTHTNVTPIANPARQEGTRYANPMGIYGARTTSEFGRRSAPQTPFGVGSTMHRGLDMTAQHGRGQTGVPVQAIASGRVNFAGPTRGYGNLVQIAHNDGFTSRYAHLDTIPESIAVGMQINAGTPIGTLGNTGVSSGPHLHLEVRDETGRPVNPRDYVNLEAKAPPIPETNPNRAETLMAENPHQGVTNTLGMAPIARDEAPQGLLGYAPTQAMQSAPQVSQAPTANPHAGVLSHEGRAPGVTVAETPSQIAAAEMAMNDPAFSFSAPSMSQVADSRIAEAFSAPASQAFSLDDADSAWGALASVTPGLSGSLAQAAQHQGPASFDMAGTVYGNHAPTFNETMAIARNDDQNLAPLDSVPYSPVQGPVAPAQVAGLSAVDAPPETSLSGPHGPMSTPTFNAPVQTTPAFNAFEQSRPANNAPISRTGPVAQQVIESAVAPPATPGSMATGGPVVALDDMVGGLFGQEGTFGGLGGLGGLVSPHSVAKSLGGMLGGAVLGPIGSAIGSRIAGGMFGPQFSPVTAAEFARAMAGYQAGLGFPGAPAMGPGMLSATGSNMSYSDMAGISPAAAAAVAGGTAGLY